MCMNQTASDPYTLKCKRKVDGEAHAVLKDVDVAGLLAQPLDCKFDQQNVKFDQCWRSRIEFLGSGVEQTDVRGPEA